MKQTQPVKIKTIAEFHKFRNLPAPEHPLISVIDYASVSHTAEDNGISWVLDFYSVSMKRMSHAKKIRYGQQEYDFNEGVLFFMAPHQVFSISVDQASVHSDNSGWILLIHPDFIWNTPLARTIKQYDYFDYAVSEALFLSEKEEAIVNGIIDHIRQEYHSNIDRFSQSIIISHIETLLNYSERFYERQFITRKITNHRVLDRLEELLSAWFSNTSQSGGLPTVQYIAGKLNMSPNYLSRLLKTLTGQSTQQFIHQKLIERAKERLSTSDLSVNEIAYELGFEHPQSFSKLFKSKTRLSPLEFRQSFN